MTDSAGNKIGIFELLRFVTPIMVTIGIFSTGILINKVDKIDEKIFKHLTNDEIHAPRSQFVEKTQFDLYQKMRDREMLAMCDSIVEIKQLIREAVKK